MNNRIEDLRKMIGKNIDNLTATPSFQTWLQGQNLGNGDIIVFNNSFVFRSALVQTTKNKQHLCINVKITGNDQIDLSELMVAVPGEMNSDFKLFSSRSENLLSLEPLEDALDRELEHLGKLIFVLIGELEDCPATVPVKHATVKQLTFLPEVTVETVITDLGNGQLAIEVNQLIDSDKAWRIIEFGASRRNR